MRMTASAPPKDCNMPGGKKPPSQAQRQLLLLLLLLLVEESVVANATWEEEEEEDDECESSELFFASCCLVDDCCFVNGDVSIIWSESFAIAVSMLSSLLFLVLVDKVAEVVLLVNKKDTT